MGETGSNTRDNNRFRSDIGNFKKFCNGGFVIKSTNINKKNVLMKKKNYTFYKKCTISLLLKGANVTNR